MDHISKKDFSTIYHRCWYYVFVCYFIVYINIIESTWISQNILHAISEVINFINIMTTILWIYTLYSTWSIYVAKFFTLAQGQYFLSKRIINHIDSRMKSYTSHRPWKSESLMSMSTTFDISILSWKEYCCALLSSH